MIVVGSDVSFPFNLTRGRQPQYHERQNAFGRHFYQKSAVFRFSIGYFWKCSYFKFVTSLYGVVGRICERQRISGGNRWETPKLRHHNVRVGKSRCVPFHFIQQQFWVTKIYISKNQNLRFRMSKFQL